MLLIDIIPPVREIPSTITTSADMNNSQKRFGKFKTTILEPLPFLKEEEKKEPKDFDAYVVSDSISSMSSFFDGSEGGDKGEDVYSNSIISSVNAKEPEELVDQDLINLLGFILKLKPPSDSDIAKKSVEFGEPIRMKTLVFDLDETLIHSWLILAHKPEEHHKDFEILLSNGGRYGVAVRPYT